MERLYFAYGSNINLEQMADRCPAAEVVGTAVLDGYGVQLEWDFDRKDIDAVLAEPLSFYAERDRSYIHDRVKTCMKVQQAKLER